MNDLKLQVFVMAARLLNFSQTAKRFGISQPAVTKRIHELEEDVKVRLFERAGSKLLLTREGEVFLKYAEQILESYEALNYELGLLQQKHAGTLRLGASTTIAQYILPPILAKLPFLCRTKIRRSSKMLCGNVKSIWALLKAMRNLQDFG